MGLVMVSTVGLKNAFFEGINFLIRCYADTAKAKLVDERIERMVQFWPLEGEA